MSPLIHFSLLQSFWEAPSALAREACFVQVIFPSLTSSSSSLSTALSQLDKSFGLLDESPQRWSNLKKQISGAHDSPPSCELNPAISFAHLCPFPPPDLNASAPEGTLYKVLWFGRHGQGYHNVAEVKYTAEVSSCSPPFLVDEAHLAPSFSRPQGTWEDYWGKRKTDGTIVWGPDPSLTDLGETQARNISKAWVKAKEDGVPLPTRWFVSPLRRTGNTCLLSWEGIFGGFGGEGRNVKVLENLRGE